MRKLNNIFFIKPMVLLILAAGITGCAGAPFSVEDAGEEIGWEILEILGTQAEYTVVINYFPEDGEKSALSEHFQGLATVSLSNAVNEENAAIKVVSRQFLDQILEEQNFQLSGFADAATQTEIGKQLGADIIVTGMIRYLPEDEVYALTVQLIEIETGVVKGGINFELYSEDF